MDRGDNNSEQEHPQFSRTRADGEQTKELRQDCPLWILNMLDAVSLAEDKTRTTKVNEILGEWARYKHHERSLMERIAGANPPPAESQALPQPLWAARSR
jgi:hypothetical protein